MTTNKEMENLISQPRAFVNSHINSEFKWTDSFSKEMNWLNNVISNVDREENEDIVERFTSMSNINRSQNRKTDREEIRRRLAMGSDSDEYYNGEKIHRKPSLQSRLQSGMNLQICFMNENTSDTESVASDSESESKTSNHLTSIYGDKVSVKRPDTLPVNKCHIEEVSSKVMKPCFSNVSLTQNEQYKKILKNECEFLKCQTQLQAEARSALIQAKEMAHMQMELERQRHEVSPITEMIRKSLEKVGISFPNCRRRLSRQILTEMNVAQLQIIANDLHAKIENLNEKLVKYLIGRDDLHMEQDSMLVDIEDLTRYLDANRSGT